MLNKTQDMPTGNNLATHFTTAVLLLLKWASEYRHWDKRFLSNIEAINYPSFPIMFALTIFHACLERPITHQKCPRTEKGIPIFVGAVPMRGRVFHPFHRSIFEKKKHRFTFSAQPQPACLPYTYWSRQTWSGMNYCILMTWIMLLCNAIFYFAIKNYVSTEEALLYSQSPTDHGDNTRTSSASNHNQSLPNRENPASAERCWISSPRQIPANKWHNRAIDGYETCCGVLAGRWLYVDPRRGGRSGREPGRPDHHLLLWL